MTPYLSTDRATLWHGDALRVLHHLEDAGVRVDATGTDPPYSSGGLHRSDRNADTVTKYVTTGAKRADYMPQFSGDNRDQRSYEAWLGIVLAACFRISRPGAPCAVFTDWRQVAATVDALQIGGFTYRGLQPWLKPKSAARPRAGGYWDAGEFVVWGTAGALIPGEDPLFGDGYVEARSPRDKVHVAEKPAEVCDWLLSIVRPGATVLDPFAGSGAIGVSALRRGCNAIMVEGEDAHVATIAERFGASAKISAQGGLFR